MQQATGKYQKLFNEYQKNRVGPLQGIRDLVESDEDDYDHDVKQDFHDVLDVLAAHDKANVQADEEK